MWRRVAERVGVATVAIGALVLAGASAGASPSGGATTAASSYVVAMSCASASHCWATTQGSMGSTIIATTDDGVHWAVQYKVSENADLGAIECPTSRSCIAAGTPSSGTGAEFLRTTDSGKGWTPEAAPKAFTGVDAISCVGDTDCWAVGATGPAPNAVLARSTDGGRSWTRQSIPKIATAMSAAFGLYCSSDQDCVVTGETTLTTTDGGRTWRERTNPQEAALESVDCPSVIDCFAVLDVTSAIPANEATFIYRSTDGGARWTLALDNPQPVVSFGDISCPTTSTCVAVGEGYRHGTGSSEVFYGVSERTTDGGRAWSEVKVTGTQGVFAASCAARSTNCVAGGWDGTTASIRRSTNDGMTWQRVPVPSP